MIKVLTIVGTRPEAIKLAPVILALKSRKHIQSVVCATGQHRQMLDQALNLFQITPDIDLNIMTAGQSLPELTGNVITRVDAVLKETRPDLVLVQGDTTTVMASAMACFYNKIRVGHVEAGLRSHHRYSPFPEEMNRRVASVLASYHFAPTQLAQAALLEENIPEDSVFMTGNTVVDALRLMAEKTRKPYIDGLLNSCMITGDAARKLILVTAHRRENFGRNFEQICHALKDIATRNENAVIVYPVHLNPNVQEPVFRILKDVERIILTAPLEYDGLIHLLSESHLVLTDSGGIQEEAPSFGKPVLVMRSETERPEGITAGVARLVGPEREAIVYETEKLLRDESAYRKMARAVNPYGDGRAAERIVTVIEERLQKDIEKQVL